MGRIEVIDDRPSKGYCVGKDLNRYEIRPIVHDFGDGAERVFRINSRRTAPMAPSSARCLVIARHHCDKERSAEIRRRFHEHDIDKEICMRAGVTTSISSWLRRWRQPGYCSAMARPDTDS
jgi:hypothetical protein